MKRQNGFYRTHKKREKFNHFLALTLIFFLQHHKGGILFVAKYNGLVIEPVYARPC